MKRVCMRCGGSGRIDRYSHYAQGLCFECRGAGETDAPHGLDITEQDEPDYESPNDLYEYLEAQDNERD